MLNATPRMSPRYRRSLPAMTDLAVAARALEYARTLSVPVTPLGAYVCAAETRFGDRIANRIPWTRGAPHPAIMTEELRLAVGWAPIASLIRAIEPDAPGEAARLRGLPASDVSVWTAVHAGEQIAVERVSLRELRAMRDEISVHFATIPPPSEDDPYYEEYMASRGFCRTRVYAEFPGRCAAGGEHDVAGPPYMVFGDGGQVVVDGRTCSKCGFDNVPQ
jgi:hypothetical protein